MNKYILIFFVLLLSRCHTNDNHKLSKNIKWNNRYVDEKIIRKTIRRLVDSDKSNQAINILDTLIYFNNSKGFLYFEKGYVEGYNFHHEAAIKDYKIAKNLGFDTTGCQFMIEASQQALDNEKLINDKIK